MTTTNISHLHTPQHNKSASVGIGLYALNRSEWAMVVAITLLIQRKEMAHA